MLTLQENGTNIAKLVNEEGYDFGLLYPAQIESMLKNKNY